jgi:hypothetical protein
MSWHGRKAPVSNKLLLTPERKHDEKNQCSIILVHESGDTTLPFNSCVMHSTDTTTTEVEE